MNENLTAALIALVVAVAQLARELRRQSQHHRGQLRTRSEDHSNTHGPEEGQRCRS